MWKLSPKQRLRAFLQVRHRGVSRRLRSCYSAAGAIIQFHNRLALQLWGEFPFDSSLSTDFSFE